MALFFLPGNIPDKINKGRLYFICLLLPVKPDQILPYTHRAEKVYLRGSTQMFEE